MFLGRNLSTGVRVPLAPLYILKVIQVKAVVWDFDGVIIDSEPAVMQAFKITLERHGIYLTEAELHKSIAVKSIDFLSWLQESKGLKLDVEPIIQEKRALALRLVEANLTAMPGSIELMNFLNKAGLRQAIASNANRKAIEDVLEKLNARGFFEVIVSSGDTSKGKPDPEPYLLALKKLDAPAEACFAIEDSPKGIQSAKAAGLKCFGLKTQYFTEAELGEADFIVENLNEIKGFLGRL